MPNKEQQFLDDASAELDKKIAFSLRKLQRQLRAAEAYEKRMQRSQKEGYLEGLRFGVLMANESAVDKHGYPQWAPSSLCNRLSILKSGIGDVLKQNNYVVVLERLCTDARMENIWYWMEKNFNKDSEISSFDILAYRFSQCIFHAFFGFEVSGWESLTQKQGQKKINQIIKLTEKLSEILEEYPVSGSVLADLKSEEFASLQNSFVRHVLRNARSKIPRYFSEKIENAAYDTPVDYGDLYSSDINLTLNTLLRRVESRLREIEFKSISTNSSDSGKLRYFIRVMASFMESHYGSRKDAQLAKIANVFFEGNDLDDKRVADLFRTKAQK